MHVSHFHFYDDSITAIRSDIANEHFDLIIDLHNNLRSHLSTWGLGSRVIRYPRQIIAKKKSIAQKIPIAQYPHTLDAYFAALSYLKVNYDGLGLSIKSTAQNNPSSNRRLIISLGGSQVTKRIPVDLAITLAGLFREYEIHLIGGADLALDVHQEFPDHVINQIGQLSLAASVDLISTAEIVITGDTGIMHITAALQVPMVVVWGSTHPHYGFAPIYPEHSDIPCRHVQLPLACRPCSRTGRRVCPLGHMNCLRHISANDILLATNEVLSLNN